MRYTKLFRVLGMAIILAMLVVTIPATPAQAAAITLSTTGAKVGDTITITGSGFSPTSDPNYPQYAAVYFSNQSATVGQYMNTNVTTYKTVATPLTDQYGNFSVTYTIPDRITAANPVNPGTYYFYACQLTGVSDLILAVATITITGAGEITIDPDEGPVDTEVEITGTNFAANSNITIKFDGDELDIEDGDTQTDSNGNFTSYIFVPESTAGAQTIRVTVASSETTAQFTVTPDIFLDKTSAEAGTEVTIEGTGFGRRKAVTIWFDNKGIATATTDRRGNFTTKFTVPDLAAGTYDVEAEDEDENLDATSFTIFAPAPPPEPEPPPTPPAPPPPAVSGSLSPAATGPVGMDLIITATGFAAGKEVTVKYDGKDVAKGTATPEGIMIAVFKVPQSKAGDHTITASDGTNTLELTFTVESEAPKVPIPLKPEMGVQVESPVVFDWEDVTDASMPVTYTLQIATSRDFTESSLVLEKEGLTRSEYTLTPEEEAKLTNRQLPYYWRIRAIDAASNKGGWTGAGEFSVTPPFTLPSWALYTFIGLGGLLLFGIGYFLGRRTAFYY